MPLVSFARTHLAPRGLALAGRLPQARAVAFRTVSQLGVRYPDTLGTSDERHSGTSSLRRWVARVPHPHPGERLPDVQIGEAGHETRWFLERLTEPAFHLLLCGSPSAWDEVALETMARRHGGLLRTHRVSDVTRAMAVQWGVPDTAHLLVRPDGHVAYRRQDTHLSGVAALLARWFTA